MNVAGHAAPPGSFVQRLGWSLSHGPHADRWLTWATIPVFYSVMGICYFGFTHMMPPPSPMKNPAQIIAFLVRFGPSIRYGFAVMMISLGFLVWANGLIAWLIGRMSLPYAKAWGYAYMASMCGGSLTGAYMSGFTLSIAAMRPDRSPAYASLLYDLTYLSFDGTMGFFLFGSLIWCVVILLDRNAIFPKWFGYTCIWNFTTEFLVGTVWIIHSGPFAWNGIISFYTNTAVYIIWQVIYAVVLFRAVRRISDGSSVEPCAGSAA